MPYTSQPRRQTKQRRKPKKWVMITVFCVTLLALAGLLLLAILKSRPNFPTPLVELDSRQLFDKKRHSIDDPASPWVVANKKRPLMPVDYAPVALVVPTVPLKYDAGNDESKLSPEAAEMLEAMFTAAGSDGAELIFVSGYRSYSYQEHLFNYFAGLQGEEVALKQSARPGHSEHQTGWAADVGAASRECEIEACFGDIPEGQWVAENAHRFGFIIRYPKGLTSITGFDYEPWHLRYVGKALAAEMKRLNTQTMEEFFGLPAASEY